MLVAAHTALNLFAARAGQNLFRNMLLAKNEAKLRDNIKNCYVYMYVHI